MESFLGRHADDVLEELGNPHYAFGCPLPSVALNPRNVANGLISGVYGGEAALNGAVRGACKASIFFGEQGGERAFSGRMWTAPVAVKGGGFGAWDAIPRDGEKMKFTWFGMSYGGGSVGILWRDKKDVIVGGITIVTAGVTAGGGDGSGTWEKE